MRQDDGYTLLELLIVMAIIALVVSVAWTSNDRGERRTLDAAAASLVDMLRLSQTGALRDGTPHSVMLSASARRWEDARGNVIYIPTDVSVQATGVEAGSEMAAITFFPQGGSTGGEILLHQCEAQRRITVNWLTGKVQQDAR